MLKTIYLTLLFLVTLSCGDVAPGANNCALTDGTLFGNTNGGLALLFKDITTHKCYSNATTKAWAVSAPYVSDATKHFCVDSTGKATTTGAAMTGTLCP
jgi:hypothetical protein